MGRLVPLMSTCPLVHMFVLGAPRVSASTLRLPPIGGHTYLRLIPRPALSIPFNLIQSLPIGMKGLDWYAFGTLFW